MHYRLLYSVFFAFCAAIASASVGAEIVVGQSIPTTGPLAPFGVAIVKGSQAYFDRVNAAGGVNGEAIRVLVLDDAGDSKRTVENARKLADQGVVALFGSIEGGPCTALLPAVAELHLPLVACMAGSPQLREPFNPYVFTVRAPHVMEFESLIKHAAQHGLTRLAFVHSDSETGRLHLANVTRLTKENGVSLVAAIALPGKPHVGNLAKEIYRAKADCVLNHGGYAIYAELLKSMRALGSDATFLAVNSGGEQLAKAIGKAAAGVIMSQIAPYPWARSTAIQREYQDDLRRAHPNEPFGFSSMEGYVSARLLVEGLRKAGARPTRDRLTTALSRLSRIDLGGFDVQYAAHKHEGAGFVDLTMIRADGGFLR
jgi:branched-chain amino acid transport system substrate-binding protein